MDQTFIRRIYLAGFITLCLSLFYYQIIKGDYYLERAKNNCVRAIPLAAIRGSIFDRNSIPLAYDKASFNLAVIPYQIKNKKDYLFTELGKILNCDKHAINKNYNKNLQNIFSSIDIIKDVDKSAILEIKEKFGDNVLINPQPKRYYPYSYAGAHILGYVNDAPPPVQADEKFKKYGYTPLERAGFSGIEQYYNTYLRGENGGDLIEVDAKGKMVGFLGKRQAQKGKDIHLTVDQIMQKTAYECLQEKKGIIILLASRSGEILTMVSSPSFDPNCFIKGKDIEKFLSGENNPLLNRSIQATYALGSTFKPLVAAAALQEGKITATTTFTCQQKFTIGIASFHCLKSHGEQNLYQAISHSCNIYFYNLGITLGSEIISQWAKKFRLDAPSQIDLPYEKTGFIPTPLWKSKELKKTWFTGDTINLAIGQGFIETSPLENLIAFNVFATGGYIVKPYLLKKVEDIDSGLSRQTYLGLAPNTIKVINQGLIESVDQPAGTAYLLKKLGLKMAGKTGTAQTNGPAHGWFMGFFPYDNPQYTICTFLENGSSSFHALKVTYNFLNKLKELGLLSTSAN